MIANNPKKQLFFCYNFFINKIVHKQLLNKKYIEIAHKLKFLLKINRSHNSRVFTNSHFSLFSVNANQFRTQ